MTNVVKFPDKKQQQQNRTDTLPSAMQELEGLIDGIMMMDKETGEMMLIGQEAIDKMMNSVVEDTDTGRITMDAALYHSLTEDSYFLNCLMDADVDEWAGYEVALKQYIEDSFGTDEGLE